MSKKKAIAAGHICLDITPAFKSKEEKDITEIFVPGQLIAMEQAKVSIRVQYRAGDEAFGRGCGAYGNGWEGCLRADDLK